MWREPLRDYGLGAIGGTFTPDNYTISYTQREH